MALLKSVHRSLLRLFLVVPLILATNHAWAENLVDIYRLAQQQDPQLRAAEAAFQAATEARPQARAALLPQISFTGSTSTSDEEFDGSFAGTPINSSDTVDTDRFQLRLDQTIYNHQNYVQLRQSKSSVNQAQAEFEAARQDLSLRVAEAYFSVLAAEDTLRFAKAEKEAIGRQLEQSEKRFEVGLIAITDVKESQASYDLAVAEEIAAQNQVDISREALQAITGQYHQNLSKLGDRMQFVTPEPANMDAWVNTALEQNLSLTASRLATDIAGLEVKKQRAGHYPDLSLFATKTNTDNEGGTTSSGETDDDTIGLELNVPIFSGGLTSSRTREARFNFRQSQELQEQQRRETVRQARASYLNVISGISRVKALKQALISNQTAAQATQAGFEVGTRTSVDVLLSLRETFRSERDYAQSRYDYLLNTLRLKQAAGILYEEDIIKINDWLN